MVEIFPSVVIDMNLQIQQARHILSRISKESHTYSHPCQFPEIQKQEENLKPVRKKQHYVSETQEE
jgi:hypothetical protein